MSTLTPVVEGAYVYDTKLSNLGRNLNKMCFSLKDADNREKFQQDEAAYCDAYRLTAEQKQAVLDRDWINMIEKGGASIFYIIKLAAIDRKSMQDLGGVFTGMTTEEFIAELRAGGRKFG